MKTPKIIIVGEREQQSKKPMQFLKGLSVGGQISDIHVEKPTDYSYIELIARNYGTFGNKSFDLIFCYNDPNKRESGVLFLGNWNDGVIE